MMLALTRPKFQSNSSFHDVVYNNIIRKYKQLGRFDDLKHTERPKKPSGHEIRHLKGLIKEHSRLSASTIATNLNASLPESVTIRAIQRYLKDLDYEYVVENKRTVVRCSSSTTAYCLV